MRRIGFSNFRASVTLIPAANGLVFTETEQPVLVLSSDEYAALSFQALHDRICGALRGRRPRD